MACRWWRRPSAVFPTWSRTVAPVGSIPTREDSPHIPITPEEVGEEARRSVEAGAAIVVDALTRSRAAEAAYGFQKYAAALIRGRRQTQDIYVLPLSSPSVAPGRPSAEVRSAPLS